MSALPIDLHWVQQSGTRISTVVRPRTIAEAAEMLANNPRLRPVAGGTDLVLELARSGTGGDASLLDLTTVDDFRLLEFDDPTMIALGAGVTHADLLASPMAVERLFPLAQACLEIGSPQLRNRATIAGNLVTASPANDTISALLALDARVHVVRFEGDVHGRTVALTDFYTGFRSTVLEPIDLVTSILVPQPRANRRGIWVKAGLRKAQAISVVHAGLVVELDDDHVVTAARVALGSVGPTVELSGPAANVLIGARLTPDVIAAAAAAAADSVSPIDDGRATADYRRDSVVTVVSRALTTLSQGREREMWPGRVPLLSTRANEPIAPADTAASRKILGPADDIAVNVNTTTLAAPACRSGTLLDWLRETAGTGTKEGCAEGECGACTVQLNGDAVMSCLVPAAQADGAQVITIEGLGAGDAPSAMQQSFVDKFAVQCGYCIPGFVIAAQLLADELGSTPTREEVELALSGNLCRCTGYYNIIDAVIAAITTKTGDSS